MKRLFNQFVLGLCLLATSAFARPGDSQNLGERDWSAVTGMAALEGRLYVSSALSIWEVDKAGKGRALPAPKDWGRTLRVTALDGKLYSITEEQLFEIDKKGATRNLGDKWYSVSAMAAMDGKLYVISSDELYVVDKAGQYTAIGKDWYNVKGMAALNGKLYVISRDRLHEVDPSGKARPLEGAAFNSPNGMTAAHGKLYVFAFERNTSGKGSINEPALYEIDPNGTRTLLPLPKGWPQGTGLNAMAVLDGTLYLVAPGMSRSNLFSLSLK
jgi:hypothetical protein